MCVKLGLRVRLFCGVAFGCGLGVICVLRVARVGCRRGCSCPGRSLSCLCREKGVAVVVAAVGDDVFRLAPELRLFACCRRKIRRPLVKTSTEHAGCFTYRPRLLFVHSLLLSLLSCVVRVLTRVVDAGPSGPLAQASSAFFCLVDFQPYGRPFTQERCVGQLPLVFAYRRGVLLFVDEADAFLRRRSTEVSWSSGSRAVRCFCHALCAAVLLQHQVVLTSAAINLPYHKRRSSCSCLTSMVTTLVSQLYRCVHFASALSGGFETCVAVIRKLIYQPKWQGVPRFVSSALKLEVHG